MEGVSLSLTADFSPESGYTFEAHGSCPIRSAENEFIHVKENQSDISKTKLNIPMSSIPEASERSLTSEITLGIRQKSSGEWETSSPDQDVSTSPHIVHGTSDHLTLQNSKNTSDKWLEHEPEPPDRDKDKPHDRDKDNFIHSFSPPAEFRKSPLSPSPYLISDSQPHVQVDINEEYRSHVCYNPQLHSSEEWESDKMMQVMHDKSKESIDQLRSPLVYLTSPTERKSSQHSQSYLDNKASRTSYLSHKEPSKISSVNYSHSPEYGPIKSPQIIPSDVNENFETQYGKPIESTEYSKSHISYSLPLDEAKLPYSYSYLDNDSPSPTAYHKESSRSSQITYSQLHDIAPSKTSHMSQQGGEFENSRSHLFYSLSPDDVKSSHHTHFEKDSRTSYATPKETSRTSHMSPLHSPEVGVSKVSQMTRSGVSENYNVHYGQPVQQNIQVSQSPVAYSLSPDAMQSQYTFLSNEPSRISYHSSKGPSKTSSLKHSHSPERPLSQMDKDFSRSSYMSHKEPRSGQLSHSYSPENLPSKTTHSGISDRSVPISQQYVGKTDLSDNYQILPPPHSYINEGEDSRLSPATHSYLSDQNALMPSSPTSHTSRYQSEKISPKLGYAQFDDSASYQSDIPDQYLNQSKAISIDVSDQRSPLGYAAQESLKSFQTIPIPDSITETRTSYSKRHFFPSDHLSISKQSYVPPEISKTSPGLYDEYQSFKIQPGSQPIDSRFSFSKQSASHTERPDSVKTDVRNVRTSHTLQQGFEYPEDVAASNIALNVSDRRSTSSRHSSKNGQKRIHPSSIVGDHEIDETEKQIVMKNLSQEIHELYKQIEDIQASPERNKLHKIPIMQSIIRHLNEMAYDIKNGICSHKAIGTSPLPHFLEKVEEIPLTNIASMQEKSLTPQSLESESYDDVQEITTRSLSTGSPQVKELPISRPKETILNSLPEPQTSVVVSKDQSAPIGYQLGPPAPGLVAVYPVYTVYPLYSNYKQNV